MFKKIKYEADLVKRWFAAVEKNDSNNEGEIDLVLELMYYFDTKSNKKLLNKFEKLPYSKTFFEQERLRDVVLKGTYLKGSLGRELQEFWNQPTYSKDLVEDGLKIIKERKNDFTLTKEEKRFWGGIFDEHDLIHFLFKLDTTTLGEITNVSFTSAKSSRKSFFLIIFFCILGSLHKLFTDTFNLETLKKKVKEVHTIEFNHFSIFRLMWEGYTIGKRYPWLLSINWHELLDEPLDKVKNDLKMEIDNDFKLYYKIEEEVKKIHWWIEYGKRTAFEQQILVGRLVRNNGIPFKILP